MILRQFLHTEPVIAASYLVGCGGKGLAAVVDPVDAPDHYIETAARFGMAIRYVIDTHVHADHLSTGRALAEAAGASYVLHESVAARFPFERVADGARLEIGNVQLEVLHLPGHTPEHLGLLVTDRARGPEPWLVLTGHTLMVGDMGRTELATSAEDGARALFTSAQRLKRLPDYLPVLPGAFSGSVCGRALSGNPTSTVGFERRFNKTFAIDDEQAFVTAMLRDIPPAPPSAAATRAANLGVTTEE
ncbi:MAG TPA: MBL fold metallo-hydrolase [Gemmatimonadaceae bacterium]|nr:MBL fold metallo-hydrolase [Gemmatimonadaceae bacterium]